MGCPRHNLPKRAYTLEMPDRLPSFSVVIPTLNAAPYLDRLLPVIAAAKPDAIVLVDSNSTDATVEKAASTRGVVIIPISNFSHGRARNLGALNCESEIVIFLSQDALPTGTDWASQLLEPFSDPKVAMTYSRQVPYADASPMERFFLASRFPDSAPIRRELMEARELTMADMFCSNVSSAIRRAALREHPFDESLIMSEDQQLARDLLLAGRAIVYTPASVVTHSHRYSLKQTFQRYFDSIYSLAEILPRHGMGTSVAIGRSYVSKELNYITRHHPLWLPYYMAYNLTKAMATVMAHHAKRFPLWLRRSLSMHSHCWSD
jgi:rhamnosyltransferase